MDPYRFAPLGEADPTSGKHVFFISDVRQIGGAWGFEITDRDETMPLQEFRYAERALAEEWHARMIADFEGMAPGIDGAVFITKRD